MYMNVLTIKSFDYLMNDHTGFTLNVFTLKLLTMGDFAMFSLQVNLQTLYLQNFFN